MFSIAASPLNVADPATRVDARRLADSVPHDTDVGEFVRSILSGVADGEQLLVLRAEAEITPAQAAQLLGVTRQYVDRLCDDGVLVPRRLPDSRHRRLKVSEVVALAGERVGGTATRTRREPAIAAESRGEEAT